MEQAIVRLAVARDAGWVADLLGELGYPNTAEFASRKLTELTRSATDTVLVAEKEGQVVGVAHLHTAELFHEPGKIGRLMAIAVASGFRRLGIGRDLMQAIEDAARQASCVRMELSSGLQRDDAHRFYQRLGYQERSKRFVKSLK